MRRADRRFARLGFFQNDWWLDLFVDSIPCRILMNEYCLVQSNCNRRKWAAFLVNVKCATGKVRSF